jgi:hypothetical protein
MTRIFAIGLILLGLHEHGQTHRHGCPGANAALDLDPAGVELDATFHDDQAQACPGTLSDITPAVKRIKEPLKILLGDADAFVLDQAKGVAPLRADPEPDRAIRLGVLDCVGEEVGENVAEQSFVGLGLN